MPARWPVRLRFVDDERVSFDLAVLAMDVSADASAAAAMFERCGSRDHVEGELDERVIGFYERLRAMFPDDGSLGSDSPWMSTPLAAGIDHVIMHLTFSAKSNPAIEAVTALAREFDLVVFDPQSGDAYLP
jgi:hypothetical protein